MNKNLLPGNPLRKSIITLVLLPLSVCFSQAQNSPVINNIPGINAPENGKDIAWNKSQVAEINIIEVAPNPALDEAKLVFNSSEDNVNYEVRIVNNLGVKLLLMNGATLKGQNTVDFPVGDFPPGVYYAQLLTPGGLETLKFLK